MKEKEEYKVRFQSFNCIVEVLEYPNGRKALELIDAKTGELVLVATTNLPNVPMASDEVAIKNYSENEGVLDVLIKAQIISQPQRYEQNGYITAPICKLLIK
jgi:hypothetical protein